MRKGMQVSLGLDCLRCYRYIEPDSEEKTRPVGRGRGRERKERT